MPERAPIIVKRKKTVVVGGHHGGAWKVAYADFVTAMMAFFLMMWLLSATTEEQRDGLADYFSPTVPVSRESGGGDGMLSGDTLLAADTLNGQPSPGAEAEGEAAQDDIVLEEIARALDASSGESTVADDLLQHIEVRTTDEGLIVDVFDLPGAPLFLPGTDLPTPLMEDLLDVIDDIFGYARNRIAVNGHVRAEAIVRRDRDVWAMSTSRAERVRRMLLGRTTPEARIERLGGFGAASPIHPDLMDVRNNRVELILLRRS